MKKVISLVLTALMLISVFTVLPAASAAETYVAGTEVRVIVTLPETDAFTGVEGTVTYGANLEYVADSLALPHIAEPTTNTAEAGSIYFNASSAETPYDVSADHVLLTANFTVLEDASSIDVATAIEEIYIREDTALNNVSSTTETTIEVVSTPTTEPVETEPVATEPVATEPEATEPEATEPNTDGIQIVGDINLALDTVDGTVYSGTTTLTSGTYKFKVTIDGATYCNGGTFTNTVTNRYYCADWRALSTFKVTIDADYTFYYNTNGNLLTVRPTLDLQLIGDEAVASELPHEIGEYYTSYVELQPGTYKFKISCQGIEYGSGKTFTDTFTNNYYSTSFGAQTTLNITTAGTYSFNYDISTNYLSVLPVVEGVSTIGGLWLDFEASEDGKIYTATTDLEAKVYYFRLNYNGVKYCNGSEYVNTLTNVTYSPDWVKSTTLKITAPGEYVFTFNTGNNTLTITQGTLAVAVTGDINLDLAKESATVYTGSTDLAIGTYSFKINIQGLEFCNGSTFTNVISDAIYKSSFTSATTFKVTTPATYTFTYDVNKNTLNVTQGIVPVAITGDINLELANESGTVYTGTTTLEAGKYNFRVNAGGTNFCSGTAQTDTITNVIYKSSFTSATPFTVTGGTYTFTFNTNTGALSVTKN